MRTFSKIATFNKSRRKKKRRRIEIICNLILEMIKNKVFMMGKVYNIINKNNI
jgi:hypothetical protein